MTIERPMFPPRADEHLNCQIIQFSAIARPAREAGKKPSAAESHRDLRADQPHSHPKRVAARAKAAASAAANRNLQERADPNQAPRCVVACRPGGGLLAGAP